MAYRTDGEILFHEIRENVLGADGVLTDAWEELRVALDAIGSLGFSEYVRGAIAVHALLRLIRYWEAESALSIPPETAVKKISRFIADNVFAGLDGATTTRLARLVRAAGVAVRREISPSVRKSSIAKRKVLNCYLCARELDPKAPDGDLAFLTLDHVWPRTVGGDSVEENLLPACTTCQDAKKDMFSWEWFNVHNFVVAPSPSNDALKSIPRAARIARHYFHVLSVAKRGRVSLRDAFITVGVMPKVAFRNPGDGLPLTFFEMVTSEDFV